MEGVIPVLKPPFEIASLARIALDSTSQLPALPGLYFVIDEAERVWYVGIAESLRERHTSHEKLASFKAKGATHLAFITESDPARRCDQECAAIQFFRPPLNHQHNFNQLPAMNLGLSPDQEIERFLSLRIQLKLIELELETLKPNIVTRCDQSGGRVVHRLGTIQAQSYKSWQFSVETEALREKLKIAQELEKKSGVAIVKSISISPVARLATDALAAGVHNLLTTLSDHPDGVHNVTLAS